MLQECYLRRCSRHRQAVSALGMETRVAVWEGRAETAGRNQDLRGRFDVVTARGFGPPAVTAECASPLLVEGGGLIVSEPPDSAGERWPEADLSVLGIRPAGSVDAGARYHVLRQTAPCPLRFPRRTGVPAKRPLF